VPKTTIGTRIRKRRNVRTPDICAVARVGRSTVTPVAPSAWAAACVESDTVPADRAALR
jgi:hypothetical protein